MKNQTLGARTTAPATAETPSELAALFGALRALDRSIAGVVNRNDRAIVLIKACISEGINTGPQIIGVLRRLGFKQGHVAITLKKGAGQRWRRDESGTYSNID